MAEVLGIHREGAEKIIITNSARIYFCDGCGRPFIWDGNSSSYGSLKDEENDNWHRIWLACSWECREKKPADFPKGVRRPNGVLISMGGRR